MLDHITLDVSNIKMARVFYRTVLKPLAYEIFQEDETWVGFAINGKPDFWLRQKENLFPAVHFAFRAKDRKVVNQFYEAALTSGGKDNGPPGIRPIYQANYYSAFVLDLDGYNIEAVCHEL
jgi:catechol 2,3-dioxygenase-like lactoylglutathione lyase family enzyme